MTRIWDETFEGSGYVESWSWGEAVDSGCTLNEDATPPGGAPAAWGSQCLRSINTASNSDAYTGHTLSSAETEVYFRIECYLNAEGLGNGQSQLFFAAYDSGFSDSLRFYWDQVGGQTYITLFETHDSTVSTSTSAISLQTFYRVELYYNGSTGDWEWKLNGTSQDSGTLSGGAPSDIKTFFLGHSEDQRACDAYFDLIAVDDADWIGAESEATTGPFDGRIDEVGIWSRALTGSEVDDLYNAGLAVSYDDLT